LKNYPGSRAERDGLYYAGLSYLELGEKDLARARFETLAEKYPAMKKTAMSYIQKLHTP
jgi:TolA-binding protein